MVKLKFLIVFLFFGCISQIFSQKDVLYDSTHADCSSAKKITFVKPILTITANPPSHSGKKDEIHETSDNHFVFETEHNTCWYLITITTNGDFSFDLFPKDSLTNDYDFVLYKYIDSLFCKSFSTSSPPIPLRSNLSRNNPKVNGKTGMNYNAKNEFVGKGIGDCYSRSLRVKKGEKYLLVLDNVSKNGLGYTLKLMCQDPLIEMPVVLREVYLKGIVKDDNNFPIPAHITVSDESGNDVYEGDANRKGEYFLKVKIKENKTYNVIFEHDSNFVDIKTISTKRLKDSLSKDIYIQSILPVLKKGKNYTLGAINFEGGTPVLLTSSYPSVRAVYKLMKKNSKMKIQIEGHVNDPGSLINPQHDQMLSEQRAKAIYDYLVLKGIQKERCSTIGMSNKMMLFPNPKTEQEQQANRRVEIKVLDY